MKKVLVIIPAYNEADNILNVVSKVKEYKGIDYIIVNDGSKDETAKVCNENHLNYINYPVNLGLTGAFRGGMRYAYYNDYDYAIQFDGDGQHNPEYIIPMMEYAEKKNLDIVIGSRFVSKPKNKSMRMLGSNLIEGCIRMVTGQRIKDPTSGMRLYRKNIIKVFATEMNYGPEPDTIAFLIRNRAKVEEYQVHMNERLAGESYLTLSSSVKYMLYICCSILVVQWFRKKVDLCQFI